MKNPVGLRAFAERRRFLRKLRGYSQQKLAAIAHGEQSTSKGDEQVPLTPTLDLLISLGRALQLEVRNLVDDPASTNSDQAV